MISEKTSFFSCFVENKLEYYRNVLLLIILKGGFSYLIFGSWCTQILYQATFGTQSIFALKLPAILSNLLAASRHLPLSPFNIHLTFLSSQHPEHSSHDFSLTFKLSVVSKSRFWSLLYVATEKNFLIHIMHNRWVLWSRGSVLAFSTHVCGFNRGRSRRNVGRTNPQHAFLRRGSKVAGPMS